MNRIRNIVRRCRNPQEIYNYEPSEERITWTSNWEFLLSCVGLSVGIGNVWRFPYMCYDNGGGAFLLPYILMLFLVGKPMYYMELAFGQYAGEAPLTIWSCVPIAKGIGGAMVTVNIIVAIYYNVIMSCTLYYMWASMQRVLPWTTCNNDWNTVACYVRGKPVPQDMIDFWNASKYYNGTFKLKTAPDEYWENKVLGVNIVVNGTVDYSHDIANLGSIKWDVLLNLLLSWIIVFFCLMKGIKSSGKVVYFTATFPYFVLLVLLIRGVTTDGAAKGIKHFLVPSWSKLQDVQVWRNALGQVFFSLSVGWGCLITFASYNKFSQNCYRDAVVVSSLDTITSIIAGFVVFSVLGALAHELGLDDLKEIVRGGPGLTFIAYSEAISRLPAAQLWAVLFYFMLYTLGLDSEFALLECAMSSISDQFHDLRHHKLPLTLAFCACSFIIALPATSHGGVYVWSLMDKYGGDIPVVAIAFCEIAAIMWIYGYKQFRENVFAMLGFRPGIYWIATWVAVAPILIFSVFVLALIDFTPEPDHPAWATALGWLLFCTSLGQIPIYAIFIVLTQKETTLSGKLKKAITKDECFDRRCRQLTALSREGGEGGPSPQGNEQPRSSGIDNGTHSDPSRSADQTSPKGSSEPKSKVTNEEVLHIASAKLEPKDFEDKIPIESSAEHKEMDKGNSPRASKKPEKEDSENGTVTTVSTEFTKPRESESSAPAAANTELNLGENESGAPAATNTELKLGKSESEAPATARTEPEIRDSEKPTIKFYESFAYVQNEEPEAPNVSAELGVEDCEDGTDSKKSEGNRVSALTSTQPKPENSYF